MAVTNKIVVQKRGGVNADLFIGEKGDVFFDLNEKRLRMSDGKTPGGVIIHNSTFGNKNSTITYRAFTEKAGVRSITEWVGDNGDVFYDPSIQALFASNGIKPNGFYLSFANTYGIVEGKVTVVFVTEKFPTPAVSFVGDNGEIFYDPAKGHLKMSNGIKPGGEVIAGL